MKINVISAATFGNKQQIVKKAAGFMTAVGAGLAADTFVKGLSKPEKAIEDEILKGNDDADGATCDEDCGECACGDDC